jgi:hypothetical protein
MPRSASFWLITWVRRFIAAGYSRGIVGRESRGGRYFELVLCDRSFQIGRSEDPVPYSCTPCLSSADASVYKINHGYLKQKNNSIIKVAWKSASNKYSAAIRSVLLRGH